VPGIRLDGRFGRGEHFARADVRFVQVPGEHERDLGLDSHPSRLHGVGGTDVAPAGSRLRTGAQGRPEARAAASQASASKCLVTST
jgi:hypothetical protein